MIPKVIRLPDVMQLTGLGATTIWRRERDGVFPPRFPLGGRAVGWLYADVMAWLEKLATQGAQKCAIQKNTAQRSCGGVDWLSGH